MEINLLMLLKAFLFGGAVCAVCQLILDKTTLTPAYILSALTVLGGVLGFLGLYEKLVKLFGGGAAMLISNFGANLTRGAIAEAETNGLLGVLTGMFHFTSSGMTAAIVFAFFFALIFDPKG